MNIPIDYNKIHKVLDRRHYLLSEPKKITDF